MVSIPIGNGPNPPPGHSNSNGMWGPSAATGSIRFNSTIGTIEVWVGNHWMPVAANPDPQSWQEWFDYYIRSADNIAAGCTRRDYIEQEMQGRFPGNYTVKHLGDSRFELDFDRQEDETWFHLKYE